MCNEIVGVNGDEGTPVPIPNTVVKLVYGDNTWLATAREDNSTPTSKQQRKLLLFLFILKKQWVFACEEEKAKAQKEAAEALKRVEELEKELERTKWNERRGTGNALAGSHPLSGK